MAIIVEEEKNRINIARILIWLTVLMILGAVVYYIFFTQPQLVNVVAPTAFDNIDPLADVDLNPQEVVDNPVFKALERHITPPVPENAGRSNPFVAP